MFCPLYCLLEELFTSWNGKMSAATVVLQLPTEKFPKLSRCECSFSLWHFLWQCISIYMYIYHSKSGKCDKSRAENGIKPSNQNTSKSSISHRGCVFRNQSPLHWTITGAFQNTLLILIIGFIPVKSLKQWIKGKSKSTHSEMISLTQCMLRPPTRVANDILTPLCKPLLNI